MAEFEQVLAFCAHELARMLEVDEASIAPTATFASLGLDSAMAVHFVIAVEEKFNVELYPSVTEDHPTVEGFSRHVATQSA